MSSSQEISANRIIIDECDKVLIPLLVRRFSAAYAIEKAKVKDNDGDLSIPLARPDREVDILKNLASHTALDSINPEDKAIFQDVLACTYREIFSQSLKLVQSQTVAFLGPEGTFSEIAAKHTFASGASYFPCSTFDEVARGVRANLYHWGILPYENSTEGVVNEVLDILLQHPDLCISQEIYLSVKLCLIGHENPDEITTIYGHSQALAQCRSYLSSHYPGAVLHSCISNGAAVQMATKNQNTLAVGPDNAAESYGLCVIKSHIEDAAHNMTRFVVIGKVKALPTGEDKTSIVLSLGNKPGALAAVLAPFANAGINMSLLSSRPVKSQQWKYNFHLDFEGHRDDEAVQKVLEQVRATETEVQILGSYPRRES